MDYIARITPVPTMDRCEIALYQMHTRGDGVMLCAMSPTVYNSWFPRRPAEANTPSQLLFERS